MPTNLQQAHDALIYVVISATFAPMRSTINVLIRNDCHAKGKGLNERIPPPPQATTRRCKRDDLYRPDIKSTASTCSKLWNSVTFARWHGSMSAFSSRVAKASKLRTVSGNGRRRARHQAKLCIFTPASAYFFSFVDMIFRAKYFEQLATPRPYSS